MKLNPTADQVEDLEIFQLDDTVDGRAHPLACSDEPPVPGFYFYARDGEPFASSPGGHGKDRYILGPFESEEAAADY